MEKATAFLSDRKLFYVAHMVLLTGNPLVDEYLATLADHATGSQGVAKWLGNRACGAWKKQCSQLFDLLSSTAAFSDLGLPTTCGSSGAPDDRDQVAEMQNAS